MNDRPLEITAHYRKEGNTLLELQPGEGAKLRLALAALLEAWEDSDGPASDELLLAADRLRLLIAVLP